MGSGGDALLPTATQTRSSPATTFRSEARAAQCAQLSLAPADSGEHDSEVVNVTDDWPSSVPITPDEVDVIEAFLRREIDVLLR